MADEDKPDKSTIMKGAAVSGIGAILPYAVLAGAGLYLYKKYGEDAQDAFSGVTGAAGGITETISNITETVSNTTKSVTTFIENNTISNEEANKIKRESQAYVIGSASGVQLPNLNTQQKDFISKYTDDKKKVRNFRETPYLNLGLGPDTTPLKRSMLGLDNKDILKDIKSPKKVQTYMQKEGLTPMAAQGVATKENKKEVKNPPKLSVNSYSSKYEGIKFKEA
jgi:hypothetical protein